MSAHTSGPWFCDTNDRGIVHGQTAYCAVGDQNSTFAYVLCADMFSGHALPFEANASLIAAAPDLLAALQTLVDVLPEDKEWGHFVDIKDAARAAIAKATAP